MTEVHRRVRVDNLEHAGTAQLTKTALAIRPGRITKLWDLDVLTVEQVDFMTAVREKHGLAP